MAEDAASVTRTGISYHTKEELIAKIAGGTVAEVKPYTQEEREAMRSMTDIPVADARWLATLAAVEKERDEARRIKSQVAARADGIEKGRNDLRLAAKGPGVRDVADSLERDLVAAQRARDSWAEAYANAAGNAEEYAKLTVALAASQASVKELRELLKDNQWTSDEYGGDYCEYCSGDSGVGHKDGCELAAALARTDDMGALEALLTEAVEAVDVDDFPIPPGVWVGEDGKETQGMKDYNAAVAKMRAAIVARLMRRAGEIPAKPVLGPYEITKGRVVPNEPKSGPYPRRAGEGEK